MSIILFLVVLVALIVVHELGHLIVAKLFKMRVDEFGIGYPPRAMTFTRKNGTDYTLNWLPFGGFVKIHGEDGEGGTPTPDSFVVKPKWQQALVLAAGILMNLVFAWILISATLALGAPRVVSDLEAQADPNAKIIISHVVAGSPAEEAGLKAGDIVVNAQAGEEGYTGKTAGDFTTFVSQTGDTGVGITVLRGNETLLISAHPEVGVIAADPSRVALGVGVATVSDTPVPFYKAPFVGAEITAAATGAVAVGLIEFFAGVFTLSADLSQVAGPVGIAGAVGDASASGLASLLSLTALISINLALINLIPIPALDGGRLLFVLIETVTRKPIPASVAGTINAIGFAFLILLMVVITVSDVFKLVG
jgi:regulator of sigma E protease